MLNHPALFPDGFHITTFPLGDEVWRIVKDENWAALEEKFQELTSEDADLYQFLKTFHDFRSIEFIIAIRDSQNEWEEDGIWHDDGSRTFAFSLSLTLRADELEGGKLHIRRKESSLEAIIPTPPFGTIILFLTGIYGFEHKIHRVQKGRRVVIAGWCS